MKNHLDLCDFTNRNYWLHHPVIGDPSFDAFRRSEQNPAYVGEPPYEWPVNGSLYYDPLSGFRYCYVSLYPETYWAKDGTQFGPGKTLLLRSRDSGKSWDNLGIILEGDKDLFDGDGTRSGTAFDAMVIRVDDSYHMLYCWAQIADWKQIGFALAHADSPEGPFIRSTSPLICPLEEPLRPGNFRDLYEGTLIRRQNDWLMLTCIRQNDPPLRADHSLIDWAPFCQALVAMTADSLTGPWSKPALLLSPQMCAWQPQPIENGVHWEHDGHIYVCQYSVASNRSYHSLFRAPVESAHEPSSWEPYRNGSVFHAEPIKSESMGIWGQPLHGYVDTEGRFQIMYPAKNQQNRGTINFASCDWNSPFKNGFWLSGTTAPSLGLVQRAFSDFELSAEINVDSFESGHWAIIWNHDSVIGPQPELNEEQHPRRQLANESIEGCTRLSFSYDSWILEEEKRAIASGKVRAVNGRFQFSVGQKGCDVFIDGELVGCVGRHGGLIGLYAEENTYLHVNRFVIDGISSTARLKLSALEGVWGAANNMKHWRIETTGFAGKPGYSSVYEEACVKWSFYGSSPEVYLPKGPEFGLVSIWLDGIEVASLDLSAPEPIASRVLWSDPSLEPGYHAVMLKREKGRIPVDLFEFEPCCS